MLEINKIYQGNCLEVMQDIDDKSIDMILCDLPYGTTACKWDNVIPFEPLWTQYKRIIKDNGAIVLTASQPFTSKLVISNLDWFRYELIWIKERPTNFFQGNKQPLKYTENILVFYKKQPTYNPQKEKKKEKNKRNNAPRPVTNQVYGSSIKKGYAEMCHKAGNRNWIYPSNFLKFSMQRGQHPTQKPVALFEYLIKTYTNEGELVLDNCIGSGTTAIACMQTNRNFIGIELEPKYVEIANKRIEEFTQQLSLV